MDWRFYCHLVTIHIDLKNAKCKKKSLITVLRITYIYINVFYIFIKNLSVLGYVSRTKQPVIRISIYMLVMDWHILLCNYSLATKNSHFRSGWHTMNISYIYVYKCLSICKHKIIFTIPSLHAIHHKLLHIIYNSLVVGVHIDHWACANIEINV